MRSELLDHLACPVCHGGLALTVDEGTADRVEAGRLDCERCGGSYPITRGIPRMNDSMERLRRTAETFSYEWKAHHEGAFERSTLFGRSVDEDWSWFLRGTGSTPESVWGAVVLDAGCGSGRFTRIVAEHGARLVIALDINEAVDDAAELCRDLGNVEVVQGNVLAPPFRDRAFDIVWSNGVIHHTPDAPGCHRALSRLVKPGGALFVWVYARRFSPFRATKSALDRLHVARWPEGAILALSKALAVLSFGWLGAYRAMRQLPGLRPRTSWARHTLKRRGLRELWLTWFDVLSPEYRSTHTEDEVLGWFREVGFEDLQTIDEPKVGVRGRAPADRSADLVGA